MVPAMERPQLGQEVFETWQPFLEECSDMKPSEWAGYKSNSRKFVFVQVAYSIWEDERRDIPPRKYRVYFGIEESKEVERSRLFKFAARPEKQAAGGGSDSQRGVNIVKLTKSKPDTRAGWRYNKQAKMDLKVARSLEKQNTEFSYMVCFLSQQVAEKALEGLVLARCGKLERGKKHRWHKLEPRIKESEVDMSVQDELTDHVKVIKNYYIETRYPNRSSNGDDIPADRYSKEDAQNALSDADKVLDIATSNMPE